MPENKNSFIKSKMNKDLDDRLIPNNEYRDANNIAVSRSENQDVGAVEAILGNELVFSSSGTLKTIGTYVDPTNGYIYYFITDHTSSTQAPSSATCQVCRWSPSSGTSTPTVLVEGYFLNFSTQSPVYGINLLENLLFWTDNRNQPRVINVQTASPSGAGVTHYTTEQSISVCKYSPYNAPQLIDLRSVSATKPSTMSDAADIPTIRIDALDWATVNLDVTRYRNGDLIEQAVTYADWVAADNAGTGAWCYYDNNFGNGVTYGKLYNRHAVKDSRNLAPYGFDLATEDDFDDLIAYIAPSLGVASIKSTSDWTTTSNIANNRTGFNALPSGERIATSAVADFQNINTHAEFWISDEQKYFQILDSNAAGNPSVQAAGSDKSGRAVRVIKNNAFKGWQGDPELMKDKFIRFSYRFKYEDGEYSLIAPFTQECFIPQQDGKFVNEDEDDTMRSTIVEFMQNNINNVILNIELPSLDIINDYKVQEIDIIYKESDALAYKVLQNIPVDTVFINNLNNTNIYQYTYQSTIPYKVLPTDETTRVYDKVPVRALAQEIAGNRVMYGNFIQGYNAPLGLDYAVELRDKNNQEYEEYPQHSVKENRNYQVGVILADKWGRQTDVILSSKDNVLVAGGEPTEGSNYFTNYRPVENAGTLSGWQGEQLALRFDSAVPSSGLYATPNNYTIEKPYSNPFSSFLNWSTQELTTVAAQAAYTFTNLSYSDTTVFTLYLNQGTGWVLIDASTYGTTDSGDDEVVVTFTSGTPATAGWKLLGKNLYNTTQYRYEINYPGFDADFANNVIPDTKEVFDVGKFLRGKYIDYIEIKSFAQQGVTDRYLIYTDKEISSTYMFQGDGTPANPTTRTEPLTDQDVTNASYNLDNQLGFYSYRVVIKQKEQEFYNVYVPGIIDGYPIQANTTEIGSTAFMVLTHDNINKVPRQLKDVSNQDKQFNSDLLCFGRVTNNETTPGNTQYSPSINPDSVELIGGIRDIFPDVEYDGSAGVPANTGKINNNAIFDVTQKPFIAKLNTQKSIGLIQTSYNTTAVAGRPDYPAYMRLSAYETAPIVSQLDLFYETSTSGLISDLNYEINSSGTQITGVTSFTWLFNEGKCGGSQITTTFWPTTPEGNDTTSLAEITETLVHDSNDQPVQPSLSLFDIVSGGSGSFYLKLKTGAERACLVNFGYLEKYQITIKFTQADGSVSYQTITRTLLNSQPIVELALAPQPEIADKTILDFTGYTPPGGLDPGPGNGPGVLKGWNGSCNSCEKTQALEWSIESFRYQDTLGAWGDYITGQNPSGTPTSTDIDYYMQITEQSAQNQATCSGGSPTNFYGVKVNRNLSTYNSQYEATLQELVMKLSDTNGTGASDTITVQWTPEADRLTGVVANYYNNNPAPTAQEWLAPPTGSPGMYPGCATASSTPVLPTWVGGIANWTGNQVYIYVKIGDLHDTGNTAISNQTVVWSGENTQNSNAPAIGDGTAAFSGPITMNYSGSDTTWQLIGSLPAFTPSNQQITDGVVPGDKGTDSASQYYDFKGCAWINNKIEWTSLNTCDGGAGIAIYYDLVGGAAPVSPQLIQPASGSPPFVTNYWYKTSGWPGA